MGGHALRGMVTAWLGLIVLQAVGTSGSGRVAGLFADLDGLVKRALDPSVPAIGDRRDQVNNQKEPVFQTNADGTVGLGPAFGTPYSEAPSGGGLIGLPPIPGGTATTWPSFNVPVPR